MTKLEKERVMQIQRKLGLKPDGIFGRLTLAAVEAALGIAVVAIPSDGSAQISAEALNHIVQFETGGKAYYEKYLGGPTWPGYSSGVTIGFGYDLAYNTKEQIESDWRGNISDSHLNQLLAVRTLKGGAAKSAAYRLRYIKIPWETAAKVFAESTLPRFVKLTLQKFQNADKLRPHALGALVGMVFNRGASLSNSSRMAEKRKIRDILLNKGDKMSDEDYKELAKQFRSMKRLWARKNGVSDLHGRRDAEADLVLSTRRPERLVKIKIS